MKLHKNEFEKMTNFCGRQLQCDVMPGIFAGTRLGSRRRTAICLRTEPKTLIQ